MSLTKEVIEDKIEVVGEHKAVQVRTATVVKEDDVELTRSFSRKVLHPCTKTSDTSADTDISGESSGDTWADTDISGESSEVQGICNAVWTDDVKTAYKAFVDSQNA